MASVGCLIQPNLSVLFAVALKSPLSLLQTYKSCTVKRKTALKAETTRFLLTVEDPCRHGAGGQKPGTWC